MLTFGVNHEDLVVGENDAKNESEKILTYNSSAKITWFSRLKHPISTLQSTIDAGYRSRQSCFGGSFQF